MNVVNNVFNLTFLWLAPSSDDVKQALDPIVGLIGVVMNRSKTVFYFLCDYCCEFCESGSNSWSRSIFLCLASGAVPARPSVPTQVRVSPILLTHCKRRPCLCSCQMATESSSPPCCRLTFRWRSQKSSKCSGRRLCKSQDKDFVGTPAIFRVSPCIGPRVADNSSSLCAACRNNLKNHKPGLNACGSSSCIAGPGWKHLLTTAGLKEFLIASIAEAAFVRRPVACV